MHRNDLSQNRTPSHAFTVSFGDFHEWSFCTPTHSPTPSTPISPSARVDSFGVLEVRRHQSGVSSAPGVPKERWGGSNFKNARCVSARHEFSRNMCVVRLTSCKTTRWAFLAIRKEQQTSLRGCSAVRNGNTSIHPSGARNVANRRRLLDSTLADKDGRYMDVEEHLAASRFAVVGGDAVSLLGCGAFPCTTLCSGLQKCGATAPPSLLFQRARGTPPSSSSNFPAT